MRLSEVITLQGILQAIESAETTGIIEAAEAAEVVVEASKIVHDSFLLKRLSLGFRISQTESGVNNFPANP